MEKIYRDSFATAVDEQAGLKNYITAVFTKMGMGVLLTAGVSFLGYKLLSGSPELMSIMGILMIISIIAQLVVCIVLSRKIMTLETSTATALFYGYAILTGITFSVLPFNYRIDNIFAAFLYAAILFFSCAVIGKTTNVDLSKFRGLMMGALIALIIATIASLFISFLRESLFLSYAGIIIFLFLTAWDMQRIEQFYYGTAGGQGKVGANLAIYGAFQLYLDFINLFIRVLEILSRNSRRR